MSPRTMGGAGATTPTYRDGLCELSECYAFPVGPRTDGLLACKAHGGVAPMSARTLPVTPAERCLAAMLRAWLAWNAPDGGSDRHDDTMRTLFDLGDVLIERGLARFDGAVTPAGAALLARVEAAERAGSEYEAIQRLIESPPEPTEALRKMYHEAAGTTPIDAPPAKEPR